MTVVAPTSAYGRAPAVGESWWYLGCLVTALATARDTAGQLSVVEVTLRKGVEPPPHVHRNEDEAFYVVEGRLDLRAGEETIAAPAGTFVWLPRDVPHTFAVEGDGARALILTTPGGFLEAMFGPFSEPARHLGLGPVPVDPPWDAMVDLDHRLGVAYPPPPASAAGA